MTMQSAARITTASSPKLTIGPNDAGQRMTWEEFHALRSEGGYRYELIDGRLVVTPVPNPRHSGVSQWIYGELLDYKRGHLEVFNHLTTSCEVVIPGHPEVTAPQPDMAAYHDFPFDRVDDKKFSWRDVAPILVVEIVSPDSADKDFYRNVSLYELESSIREYWIIDPRDGINQRTMKIYRRRGKKWQKPICLAPGDEYTTKLLPDFCLRIEPLT
jgi:Uma2 family endonuclease